MSTGNYAGKYSLLTLISLALLLFSGLSNATVYIQGNGSTQIETFSYTFEQDFTGEVTIGVSNEEDNSLSSYLELFFFGGVMTLTSPDNSGGESTSAYTNSRGESGTKGEMFSWSQSWKSGDTMNITWRFSTSEEPGFEEMFNDFSFISIGKVGEALNYSVLAEIGPLPVPVPAAVWLFGGGLLGLLGLHRRPRSRLKA